MSKFKELFYERKWGWEVLDNKAIMEFGEEYKDFLGKAKTEREAVEYAVSLAEKNGFKKLGEANNLKSGDRVYEVYKNKLVALAVIGHRSIIEGTRIIGAHIDAPRLDLKPQPLFEEKDAGLAIFKTQYYGGVKKYQWASIPLALHGVVTLADGGTVKIVIGENENEAVLTIPDLAPHIARKKQGERKGFELIEGEELKILVGNMPIRDKEVEEKVKAMVLKILKERYGISEEDFVSADLEVVPAFKPRDVGLDKSMIGGYGQDDRICAYTTLRAILDAKDVEYTAIALLVDREEIGSAGNTGATSEFIKYFISKLILLTEGKCEEWMLREALLKSRAISADVNVAIHPAYKDVHDIQNAAVLGKGVVVTKYTGGRGKGGASEAHAEYVGWVRKILNEKGIPWQPGLLGKVDEGGGGTIAKFLASYGMDVVDMGPALLAMHSPFEVCSKADLYSAYLAYKAFYEAKA
ncbi:MAG: aminopeptidase [Thermoprotei archaeon]|nr:MAG: aminopeptidase [Thermoprotei archaeon]